MILMLSCVLTLELLGKVVSGVIWARAQFAEAIAPPTITQLASAN
jgi:hypothetical protein